MRSFVCKHFHPNWFRVVFQFCDRHMWNVLMDEQHDPVTMDISVFSIYSILASFRKEFWSCNRTVGFGFLVSYNMWLMKSRKACNSSFLLLMLLIIILMNFNPLIKLLLFVPQGEDISFFSFVRPIFSFQVHLFTKEGIRKVEEFTFRSNPCTICIVHSFILSFCNEWAFIMDPHITTVTLNCFVTL